MNARQEFYFVVRQAVDDLARHGFDSIERVARWEARIRKAAEKFAAPRPLMEQRLKAIYLSTYKRLVENKGIAKYHKGVERFTLTQVGTQLRSELDRRIAASAALIQRNRQEAINKTLQRFSGWSTSIPKGGSDATDKPEAKSNIKKALVSLPFEERRVLIDQGHKLTASLNNIIAKDAGAIALIWRSNWRQPGYDYREDHKERDERVYAIRDSWAFQEGYAKPGKAGYYDTITAVAEEPYCRCYAQYLYTLSALPKDMLTRKGAEALNAAKKELAA